MKLLLTISFLLAIISCSHIRSVYYGDHEVKSSKIATGYEMKSHGNIYIGAQPSSVDFIKLRQEGFVAIVNLRNHGEKNGKYNEKWERNNSLLAGMSYYHVGFNPKTDYITKEFVNKISGVVSTELERGKVLVHCASGQRAAMWLGANLKLNANHSIDKAMTKANEAGMSKEIVVNHLSDFLKKN